MMNFNDVEKRERLKKEIEENDIEWKVYSSWAGGISEHKLFITMEIYNKLLKNNSRDRLEVERVEGSSRNRRVYNVVKNPDNLSLDEVALLLSNGNLAFGHSCKGENQVVLFKDD